MVLKNPQKTIYMHNPISVYIKVRQRVLIYEYSYNCNNKVYFLIAVYNYTAHHVNSSLTFTKKICFTVFYVVDNLNYFLLIKYKGYL